MSWGLHLHQDQFIVESEHFNELGSVHGSARKNGDDIDLIDVVDPSPIEQAVDSDQDDSG